MTDFLSALHSTTWKCPHCQTLNDETITCTNCSYDTDNTFFTNHELAFEAVNKSARYLFTSLFGGILFILAPIVLYIMSVGGQTIPGWLVITQIFVGIFIYQTVLYTVWNIVTAVFIKLVTGVPYGLARTLATPPYSD